MSNAIVALVNEAQQQFSSRSIADDVIFEVEAGFAIQALSTDYASKIALQNRQSVIDAVTNVAAIGISLNPAKKQAYLVPRDGRICLDISYMGLIDLAVATGSILWAQCVIVHENDTFWLEGFDAPPTHKYSPFDKGSRGEIIGAYACVKTPTNDYLTHSMPLSEIYNIRDRSAGWKSGKNTPWKTDEGEMIKKTVIKQAYKYWPKTSPRLENAIHHLNTETVEGLADLQPTRKSISIENQDYHNAEFVDITDTIQMLEVEAGKGKDEFRSAWRGLDELLKKAVGKSERDRIDAIAAGV